LAQRSLYAKHCSLAADKRGLSRRSAAETEIDADNCPANTRRMAKKSRAESTAKTPRRKAAEKENSLAHRTGEGRGEGRPSSLLDTRVIYCGDNLEQLAKLPDACVDLIYIDPPFNSNRNYEVFLSRVQGEARL
jgi:16S rRNA G966 N2-methylase RsmD